MKRNKKKIEIWIEKRREYEWKEMYIKMPCYKYFLGQI